MYMAMSFRTLVPENLEELPLFIERHAEFGFEYIKFSYDVMTVPPCWPQIPTGRNGCKLRRSDRLRSATENEWTWPGCSGFSATV
jgi:hypothetical protein